MVGLIFKVFLLSIALSIAIKYGAPMLPVAPTLTTVLIAVWLPAAIATVALVWRWRQGQRQQGTQSIRKGQT
ncbi:MAG: hypothetical protein ACAF41_03970 [Leptolyngbya sp. BL-A-14]